MSDAVARTLTALATDVHRIADALTAPPAPAPATPAPDPWAGLLRAAERGDTNTLARGIAATPRDERADLAAAAADLAEFIRSRAL